MLDRIAVLLVLVLAVGYIIKTFALGKPDQSSQNSGCSSCDSACHSEASENPSKSWVV